MLTTAQMFTRTARRYPERIGHVADVPVTYREWDSLVESRAEQLAALGVQRGSHVATVIADGSTFATSYLALQRLDAVVVPLSGAVASSQLAYCIEDSGAETLIVDDESIEQLRDPEMDCVPAIVHAVGSGAAPRLVRRGQGSAASRGDLKRVIASPEAHLSVILYTAGTTGQPKGVPRDHSSETLAALAHVVQAGYTQQDVVLAAMPMHHTMGLRTLLAAICIGASVVFMPAWNAELALDAIAAHEVSSLYMVPTAFYALNAIGNTQSLPSVCNIGCAGAPMLQSLSEELTQWLGPQRFINHYGCTEVYTIAVEGDAAARPGSVGRPGLFSDVMIAAPDARAPQQLTPGETGEILVHTRSAESFAGYWNRPDLSERAMVDGWYRTGDLGYLDDRGDMRLLGRTDDMIITGGENVYPMEVEERICQIDGVGEVCVVGLEDERWGSAITAFITLADERDEPVTVARATMAAARRDNALAAHQRPKRVIAVRQLPKSSAGKLLRRDLLGGRFEGLAEARTDFDPSGAREA